MYFALLTVAFMGCGASASGPAGSRVAKKAPHVNPSKVIKGLQEEFEGTDVGGFEKASVSRQSTIEGSDGLWSLNERTLAQKHGLEWLLKRRKVEQFIHSMQGYGVPFSTVAACIQLFQEGAGWPQHTPSLTESLFVKCVLRSQFSIICLSDYSFLVAQAPLRFF
jgi:hypothetical protein